MFEILNFGHWDLFVIWCLESLPLANPSESFIIPSYHIDVKFDFFTFHSFLAQVTNQFAENTTMKGWCKNVKPKLQCPV